MTQLIVNTTILSLIMCIGGNTRIQQANVIRRTLVQEQFVGGTYLESGISLGNGNLFFSTQNTGTLFNLDKIDTVFVFDIISPVECFTFQEDPNCAIKNIISSKNLDVSRKLIRNINKSSLSPGKVRKIRHQVVKCEYQICKVDKGVYPILNYSLTKRKDPLIVLKDVVVVHITCPKS